MKSTANKIFVTFTIIISIAIVLIILQNIFQFEIPEKPIEKKINTEQNNNKSQKSENIQTENSNGLNLTRREKKYVEEIVKFVDTGFFNPLFKENGAKITDYGLVENSNVPNTFVIRAIFPQKNSLADIKRISNEFFKTFSVPWSVGYNWRTVENMYSICLYQNQGIAFFFYYSPDYPEILVIHVNTYENVIKYGSLDLND